MTRRKIQTTIPGETIPPGKTGRPPEGAEYEDLPSLEQDGCQFSASCLQCPLPVCKHEMSREELKKHLRARQDAETVRNMKERRLSPKETANEFGISVRTVYRILERAQREKTEQYP